MDAPFFLLREFLRVFAFYHQHSGDHEHAEGRDQQQAVFRRLKGSAERESPKEESSQQQHSCRSAAGEQADCKCFAKITADVLYLFNVL